MKKKLTLELETLSVDSFQTSQAQGSAGGTVRAREDSAGPAYYDCTCFGTCLCRTAYYWCGDGYQTIYSCTYTQNESCEYTKVCPPTS